MLSTFVIRMRFKFTYHILDRQIKQVTEQLTKTTHNAVLCLKHLSKMSGFSVLKLSLCLKLL